MGKASMMYLNEKNKEHLDLEINKSKLINRLLEDYYSDNEEALTQKKEQLLHEVRVIDSKLELKKRQKEQNREDRATKEQDHNKNKKKIDLIEKWQFAYNNDTITDQEYWDAYDKINKVFVLSIIETKLEGLKANESRESNKEGER